MHFPESTQRLRCLFELGILGKHCLCRIESTVFSAKQTGDKAMRDNSRFRTVVVTFLFSLSIDSVTTATNLSNSYMHVVQDSPNQRSMQERLERLFTAIDVDRSDSLSRSEFFTGMREALLPHTDTPSRSTSTRQAPSQRYRRKWATAGRRLIVPPQRNTSLADGSRLSSPTRDSTRLPSARKGREMLQKRDSAGSECPEDVSASVLNITDLECSAQTFELLSGATFPHTVHLRVNYTRMKEVYVSNQLEVLGECDQVSNELCIIDGGGVNRLFFVSTAEGNLTLSRLHLTNGNASEPGGGAVSVVLGARLAMHGCKVTHSVAKGIGGGGMTFVSAIGNITNSIVSNCSSTGGGGCIVILSSLISVINSTLTNCFAEVFGGAIYMTMPDLSADLAEAEDHFWEMETIAQLFSAPVEGKESRTAAVSLEGNVIMNNSAGDSGGAIYINSCFEVFENLESDFHLSNNVLQNNFAVLDAGGLASTGDCSVTIQYSSINENFAVVSSGGNC